MICSFVRIAGTAWELVLPISSMPEAEALIAQLLHLKGVNSLVPLALKDTDQRLIGFLVPAHIISASFHASVTKMTQEDLMAAHKQMLEAQTAFYKSHTDND